MDAARRRPRRRRRSRPGRPTSWKCTSSAGIPCTRPSASASRAKTSWASERTSSCRPASAEQPLDVAPGAVAGRVGDLDVAAGRGEAAAGDLLARQADLARGRPCRRPRPAPPAARRRRAARRAACRRWRPRRRRPRRRVGGRQHRWPPALRAHPGGEDAGAVPVVDVDHRHARGAGVQHREQRGQPAEGGAVPDAGRHRDERYADSGRRPRWAGRPPSRPPRPGSRRRRSRSRTSSSRCSPATPTSSIRSTPGAVHRRRSAPPRRRRGRPRCRRRSRPPAPRGSAAGPSVAARATASTTASGSARAHGVERLVGEPGREHRAVGVPLVQACQDLDDLLGRLAGAVDHLRVAGARGPVEVDPGEAEVGGALGSRVGSVTRQTIRAPAAPTGSRSRKASAG